MIRLMRIVGKIAGFHGLKGEVKIYPLLDDLAVFKDFEELKINDKLLEVESCRFHKNMALIKFVDRPDRTSVEDLTGYVEAEHEEELAEGEFYIADLLGLDVRNKDSDESLGKVKSFIEEGQLRLTLDLAQACKLKQDLIVPYVDEYILDVNLEEGYIRIDLREDLLEIAR